MKLEDLMPIINSFEDFYKGCQNRNWTQCRALFPHQTWSVYKRTLNREDRTNNHVEAAP